MFLHEKLDESNIEKMETLTKIKDHYTIGQILSTDQNKKTHYATGYLIKASADGKIGLAITSAHAFFQVYQTSNKETELETKTNEEEEEKIDPYSSQESHQVITGADYFDLDMETSNNLEKDKIAILQSNSSFNQEPQSEKEQEAQQKVNTTLKEFKQVFHQREVLKEQVQTSPNQFILSHYVGLHAQVSDEPMNMLSEKQEEKYIQYSDSDSENDELIWQNMPNYLEYESVRADFILRVNFSRVKPMDQNESKKSRYSQRDQGEQKEAYDSLSEIKCKVLRVYLPGKYCWKMLESRTSGKQSKGCQDYCVFVVKGENIPHPKLVIDWKLAKEILDRFSLDKNLSPPSETKLIGYTFQVVPAPLTNLAIYHSQKIADRNDPFESTGTVSKLSEKVIEHDYPTTEGSSGSPLIQNKTDEDAKSDIFVDSSPEVMKNKEYGILLAIHQGGHSCTGIVKNRAFWINQKVQQFIYGVLEHESNLEASKDDKNFGIIVFERECSSKTCQEMKTHCAKCLIMANSLKEFKKKHALM